MRWAWRFSTAFVVLSPGVASATLVEEDTVPGVIEDFDEGEILYWQDGALWARDRESGADVLVTTASEHARYGMLAADRILYVVAAPEDGEDALFEWRDGGVASLGPVAPGSLVVRGDFAVWTVDETLHLRDLRDGTTREILGVAEGARADLAPGGVVAFATGEAGGVLGDRQIVLWQDGVSTPITTDETQRNFDPRTDGFSTVFPT